MNDHVAPKPVTASPTGSLSSMVPSGHFKRAGGFDGLRKLITAKGGQPDVILRKFGIDPEQFDNSESYVSYPDMVRLLDYCAQTFDSPFFGFEVGRGQSTDVIGPLAALLLSASTVAEGLELVGRYMAVHAPGARMRLEKSGGEVWLIYEILDQASSTNRHINELSMAAAFNTMQTIAGRDFALVGVEIASHSPDVAPRPLDKFFGVPVDYEASRSAIGFSQKFLQRKMDTGNPTLLRFARAQFETFYPDEEKLEQIVATHIRRLMPMGGCSLEMVAQQLSIHPRSLQNRLTSEGVEFRQILRSQRIEMAKAYLTGSRTPIAEVASLLGYSDQATFTRAFSSWFETTPKRYRIAHNQPAGGQIRKRRSKTEPVS